MPRPNKPRTIGAEAQFRENLRDILQEQERSTAWLVRRMNDLDCPAHPTLVWDILNQGRTIHVDEALAICEALGVPLTEMYQPR